MSIDKQIREKAKDLLYSNLKRGYSSWKKTTYSYVCPARKVYPGQFFWDSCFHAVVWTHFDLYQAKEEIKTLLKAQELDGFVPHVIFWQGAIPYWGLLESDATFKPRTSSLIQPPLLAYSVQRIYQKDKDNQFLAEVYPSLKKYYDWVLRERDPDEDGLVALISPNESGMDEKPSFDLVCGINRSSKLALHFACRRVDLLNKFYGYDSKVILEKDYFNVEDVSFNSIFAFGLNSLAKLSSILGEDEDEKRYKKIYKKTLKSLIDKCYDPNDGFFYDIYSKFETKLRVKTVGGLLPLILEDLPKSIVEILVKEHFLNEDEFYLPYPIPSVAKNESSFHPEDQAFTLSHLLWRGPTWINTNWFVFMGLKSHSFDKEAKHLLEKTKEMVLKSGFREYYNPFTAEGYRSENFGWSTLLVDMLESQ
ncbi:MAG: hypothetical protein A2Y57_04425 [Candidatus Woykebacteria bacterium RBG_13_40_7b]|uniref:Mannosylglycerate hydrolase MGH1-like glycoside hydrolase domain-containing protein n=1 Tax=Candidatus Woykebacteria bacterium RBG_13_40_7b TaxID=1802594 RepID=A0A1G1W804_9BACT|nr:MAG: hypothetical protein A2Y57_04425 [Candidatus Woykebacteria bacterium RBG_13_40_7b]